MRRAARVYTIPASAPFLPTLIAALREGRLVPGFPEADDPLSLTRATLYVPTRRAGRLAEAAFAEALAPRAVLLPRIVPLGDVDEDAAALDEEAPAGTEALPPPIAPLARRLLLARLVARLAATPELAAGLATSPVAALALADELGALMDRMAIGRIDWAKLDTLVPDDLDPFFQISARFLALVAHEQWPRLLAARGEMEPMLRRDQRVASEARRLAAGAGGPVIAAGSTGSIPATRDLLAAIARHPQGAVVLPGLDSDLDGPAWDRLPGDGAKIEPLPTHPQFGLHQLLATIGLPRDEVTPLAAPAPHGRERLLSEALRPAETTEAWRALPPALYAEPLAAALATVALAVAADAREEALVAAIALRSVLETPGRTAALITPDRALARRVAAELTRWGVAVDDSAGVPLAETPAGVFARLVAEVAARGAAPVPLTALLGHAHARFGLAAADLAAGAAALERAVLRGPRPRAGLDGLAAALAQAIAARTTLHPRDPRRSGWHDRDAQRVVEALRAALAPLMARNATHAFVDLVQAHRAAVAAAAQSPSDSTLVGADADMLAALFEALEAGADDAAPLTLADYAELLPLLMRGLAVRPPFEEAAPIRILGPLEARLVPLDRVVLAGLVEGIWPPDPKSDPWLSRPMRLALGLDLPERRIGLSAHDFAQAMGAPDVVLTYAAKTGGAPSVPARFLQRLAAVAGAAWQDVRARGAVLLAQARALDVAPPVPRAARPSPCPPPAARPTRLSVTEITDLVRDPYVIHARHVLRLAPLDPLDAEVGAAARGTLIHDALAAFLATHPQALPADALDRLIACGRDAFAAIAAYPELHATWWPRFLAIARWFVDEERARRAAAPVTSHVEQRGELAVPGTGLTLSARADRLDVDAAGRVTVIDYKTGAPPSNKQVTQTPFAPQLPLEAALVTAGAFSPLAAGSAVDALAYVRLTGGVPAGEWKARAPQSDSIAALADRALALVRDLAIRYGDPAQGYTSRLMPETSARHGDYDHLARVAEWSLTGGAEGADGADGEGGE